MARRFTHDEEKELRALLAEGAPLRTDDVRRILQLPELPHANLLGDDTWLLGGRVLRWLSGEMDGTRDTADYDFYCGSVAAYERTTRRLLDAGFTPCRRRGPPTMFRWLMGMVFPRDEHAACAAASAGSASMEDLLKVRKLPDGSELYILQVHSLEGHLLQLIHLPSLFPDGPRVGNQVDVTDLSICQFTLDGSHVHAGPDSWEDLFRRRVHAVHIAVADRTLYRLVKYARRGFWPRWQALRAVGAAWRAGRRGRG